MIPANPLSMDGAAQNALPGPYLSKRRKAAIIVRLLLREGAEFSLADLPESMQIDLTHEMGALRSIDQQTLDSVVQEFLAELDNIGISFTGGLEGALQEASHVISPSCANRLRREAGVPVVADPWGFLAGLDVEQLSQIVGGESTEIAAVILSKLPVAKSAEVLSLLPAEQASGISYAVSRTGVISPKTVQSIGSALAEQLVSQPTVAFDDGPVGRLGAILNSSTAATRDDVLEGLEGKDQAFAEEVKKAIFTFTNIPERIDPRDIPKITRAVDQGLLVTGLAAAQESAEKAVEFVLENMSQRMAQQIRDEMQDMGAIKPKDAEIAMTAVVTAIRDMEAAGELVLLTGDDD
ncbi:MAG: FliG C-terminal domain-containing protein [Pseudomonadota bacterium]